MTENRCCPGAGVMPGGGKEPKGIVSWSLGRGRLAGVGLKEKEELSNSPTTLQLRPAEPFQAPQATGRAQRLALLREDSRKGPSRDPQLGYAASVPHPRGVTALRAEGISQAPIPASCFH